ncbi:MAG: DNA phosphorothioation system sulfurtransferase DndC [Ignavibacteria bacterium]|nr:DNA phosphorothioation system sulfurtransferase DndC [Ignavibacteria bacterium]
MLDKKLINETTEFFEVLNKKITKIIREIKEQYLEDNFPWIIGFSGGKDSTVVLQLIFNAIKELEITKRNKEIHVLANDTLVENPNISNFIDEQLKFIEIAGKNSLYAHNPQLFNVAKVTPKLIDTFWLNLIGKGYPSPTRWFRWCTEKMKINPTNEYIKQEINKNGKVIIVLGTRKSESANRNKTMKKYEIFGMRLRKHSLGNAFVFSPIADLSTQEVWAYLINNKNPWGVDNEKLLNLYRNASDIMDCPLVIDDTTPSCGNSRFGCWVCTVIEEDKSMYNLIKNGEDWMLPLYEFRTWLKTIRNEPNRRDKTRRNGQDGLGPFNFETRKEILEKLLKIELETGLNLISRTEISAIEAQWRFDGNYKYSVANIYYKIKGEKLMGENKFKEEKLHEEEKILERICEKHSVKIEHIKELMELEKKHLTFLRRSSIHKDMQSKISKFINNSNT